MLRNTTQRIANKSHINLLISGTYELITVITNNITNDLRSSFDNNVKNNNIYNLIIFSHNLSVSGVSISY